MSRYLTALVCKNGHIITSRLENSPEKANKYCKDCGAETLSTCQECGERIHGYYDTGVPYSGPLSPPKYCHKCGSAYPWTKDAKDAWYEIAEEAEKLTDEERSKLAKSIDDLISDTPRTQSAVLRIKRIAPKLVGGTWDAMQKILISVASDAVKKGLGLK